MTGLGHAFYEKLTCPKRRNAWFAWWMAARLTAQ